MAKAEAAAMLAKQYLEQEGIEEDYRTLLKIAHKWAITLPRIDVEGLAAVAIADPYEISLTANEVFNIKQFYFPNEGGEE